MRQQIIVLMVDLLGELPEPLQLIGITLLGFVVQLVQLLDVLARFHKLGLDFHPLIRLALPLPGARLEATQNSNTISKCCSREPRGHAITTPGSEGAQFDFFVALGARFCLMTPPCFG